MLAALIIVFREVFEAGLIVGIVLAATRAIPNRSWWIGGGVLVGAVVAGVIAGFAGALSRLFEGTGQELLSAGALGLAVVMLVWHNVWMSRHGRELANQMRVAGEAVAAGSRSLLALAVVVGVAVLREGSEVALFLYGIIASGGEGANSLVVGGGLGLLVGAGVCLLTYLGLLRIKPRPLFLTTSALITLLAAGMAAQATAFLERANWITALDYIVWDSAPLLSDKSIAGRALHTLVGYTDQPTLMQLVIYLATLLITVGLMKWIGSPQTAERGHASELAGQSR